MPVPEHGLYDLVGFGCAYPRLVHARYDLVVRIRVRMSLIATQLDKSLHIKDRVICLPEREVIAWTGHPALQYECAVTSNSAASIVSMDRVECDPAKLR